MCVFASNLTSFFLIVATILQTYVSLQAQNIRKTGMFCSSRNKQAKMLFEAAVFLSNSEKVDDWIKAKFAYSKAIELDSTFCDAMDNLAIMYRHEGDLGRAAYWYTQSLKVAPANPVARVNLAFIWFLVEDSEKAEAEYRKLTELYPPNPEGFYGLALVYALQQNKPQQALVNIERAVALYRKEPGYITKEVNYVFGVIQYKLSNWREAIKHLKDAYGKLKKEPDANLYLGLSYWNLIPRDEKNALKYLRIAKDLGAKIPDQVASALE